MASHVFKTIIFIVLAQLTLQWCLKSTYNEIGSQIHQVDWSPDGQYIVTGSKSQRVTVISASTSNVVWFDTLSNQVTTTKFSKTGKWLGVGQMGTDTIRIYNVPSFTLNMSFRAEHSSSTNDIFQLDFNSDDTKMITCGSDGHVNQRILGNGTSSNDWKGVVVNGKDVLTCKYSSDDRVGCFCDKQMYLLKADGTIDEHQAKDVVRDVDFRPGGHKYLYGGCTCDHHLKEFDTNADKITDYFNTKDIIYAVSYASDSSFLVTGGKAGHVYIYNTSNVNSPQQQAYFQQQNIDINSVRVSDDSNFVAVSKVSGAIDIYARNCMLCPHGYYNNQSACRMCVLDINQCASCKNSTLCYFCFSGYYLNPANPSQCIICRNAIVGCILCKSDTVCLNCTQGYYLTGNNCKACASLTPLCESCLSNGTCIKCSYISYLSSSNSCSLCSVAIPNCRACYDQYNTSSPTNSTLYCRQCVRGYYASQVQCLPCSSNCIMCASTGTCLACAQQYKLSGTTCAKCNQYCEGCNESGTCYQCIPTTFLLSGSCSLCAFPCLTCVTAATTCKTCALGYYISGTNCVRCVNCPFCNPITGVCISCPVGKYWQSPNCLNCLNATSHCAICNATACLACERNFYLTGTNTCALSASISDCQIYRKNSTSVCDHCKLGFYLDTAVGTCFKCMTSCSLCDNPSNCTQCQIGYYLISANLTCAACADPCKTCNSSTECLSCGQQYYLSGTQCLKCWIQIPFCNSCMNSTHCLDCFIGYQVASNSLSCISCASPCTACNSTGCLSCEQGYFYLSNACTRCPVGCTSCTSLTNCQQCLPTYVGSGSACVSCQSLFSNCLTCSLTGCITCKPYFSFNSSLGACSSCNNSIPYCLACYNGLCQTCVTGNYPAAGQLSCVSCSATMAECEKCINGTACDECRSGFYLSAVNQCSKCTDGCRICSNSLTCDICDTGFILNASVCIACSQQVFGCKMCTLLGGCSQCSIEYYLATTTSCLLCRSSMIGCVSCTSSTTCSSCDPGYFLNSSSKCQPCNISGCSICNQSSAACSECITGFYLASPTLCSLCSATYSNCAVCNSSQCLRCESGTYLTSLNTCSNCITFGQSCIFCNTSHCLQCEAGFYLRSSDSSCQICSITGCQVCSPNGASCLSCENTYYLANSLCSSCYTMDYGCVSCSGFNTCLLCKTGYYLQGNGTCALCSSRFFGCQICTGLACESCQTNYFQNSTSISKDCLLCNSFMSGCSLCIDQNQCLVCESGYYIQNSQCLSCTTLNQCLICNDNTTCLFCTEGHYLQSGQCLSCSNAILGCFSCLSSSVCVTCGGSYSLKAGVCQMIKGVPPKNYTEIKVKSFYVNETHLKHTIYLKGMEFKRIDQQWNSVTTIEVITPPNNKAKLTILAVDWGRTLPLITLDFYTNNPFGSFSNNNNMPFLNSHNKRVLFSLDELNMAVNFQMKRAALDEILPDLDTNRQDLSMEYFMDEPQFYRSLVRNQKNYYYLFGIAVTTILIFVYFIKIMCLSSITSDTGEIIPHILLNKVCAMIIYPTLGGYINYCEGFTYIDFPWLNTYFSQLISNLSDESPHSYKMFYNNLNIASTYLLACIVFTVAFLPLYIFTVYKNRKRMQGGKGMIKPRREDSSNGSDNSDEKEFQKTINRFQLLTQYIYNIFSAGLIFASFTNLLGMILNPTNIISVSGLFYILGTFIYVFLFLNAVKSFTTDKIKFNRLRVIIKASFLALMFWSPILLFSALVVIEIGMIMIQYKIKIKQWLAPKAWVVCNILNLMSYASLIFLSNMILGLLISSASIVSMLIIDGYLIYVQSQQYEKIKKLRNVRQDSILNFTIEQFEPNKTQSKMQEGRNFYFDENEKDMSKIRSVSTSSLSKTQGKESKISKTTLSKIEEELSKRSNKKSPNRKILNNQLE